MGHKPWFWQSKQTGEIAFSEENVPEHIAIIMDGNGRWAKKGLCRVLPGIMKA